MTEKAKRKNPTIGLSSAAARSATLKALGYVLMLTDDQMPASFTLTAEEREKAEYLVKRLRAGL